MAFLFEVGTWTCGGSSPQPITLTNTSLAPVAIIAWTTSSASLPAAGAFTSSAFLSIGFGTRRGGTGGQSGSVSISNTDNVATGAVSRIRNDRLLHVIMNLTTRYTVGLEGFATGVFTASYSSATIANGDVFHYAVFGGDDLTDAIVVNTKLSSGTPTHTITGVGFQPNVLFCLDSDLTTTGTFTSNSHLSFGCATSDTQAWSLSTVATNGDTMASTMNWNKSYRTGSCLERLTINADTLDALWDLNSFNSDGCELGVLDAPTTADRVSTFLFIKGGAWEAGTKAKNTTTGDDTFTLANTSLEVKGVIMAMNRMTAVGITAADMTLAIGAGSSPNTTRGSAVNNCLAISAPEAINTTADRFRATDSIIEEISGSATPAETSEAFYDSATTGSFIIDWAVNGGSAALVSYIAFGSSVPAAPVSFVPMYTLATTKCGR